jgi:hypothetical protein
MVSQIAIINVYSKPLEIAFSQRMELKKIYGIGQCRFPTGFGSD